MSSTTTNDSTPMGDDSPTVHLAIADVWNEGDENPD